MNQEQINLDINKIKKQRDSDLRKIMEYERNCPDNVTQKELDKMIKLLYAHRRQLDTQMKMLRNEI